MKEQKPLFFQKLLHLVKMEAVLCIAGAAVAASMFFTPPTLDYLTYVDFRVLALLFCLMAVVAGAGETGLFLKLSERLLNRCKNTRALIFILVLLCFFTSMWITNDVALITFVPFAILLLTMAGQERHLIFTIVGQTIAANLGSMLTPVGNPQNLFLFTYYRYSLWDFIQTTLPITLVSLGLLFTILLFVRGEPLKIKAQEADATENTLRLCMVKSEPLQVKKEVKLTLLYFLLFILCLLCVLRILDYRITFLIVFLAILIFDRGILKKVDYSLLLTFLCFFLFVGNIGQISAARDFLGGLLDGRELPVAVLLSQIISNVPAAVLLSSFTENSKALLWGTNLGGLGTLVASLASLISFKYYCRLEGARPLRYLGIFTLYNLLFLALLSIFVMLL